MGKLFGELAGSIWIGACLSRRGTVGCSAAAETAVMLTAAASTNRTAHAGMPNWIFIFFGSNL